MPEPGKFGAPIEPATPPPAAEPLPVFSAAEQIPVAASKEDLQGPGSLATAIVAPKAGDIPVAAGTPVVVIAKHLRDSPTVKKFFRAVCLAWGAFWAYVLVAVIVAGGPFKADWIEIAKAGTLPATVTLAGVYGIKVKAGDNDPVISGSLKGSAAGDAAAEVKP